MLTYSIYGVIAAAVMRVFTDVSLSFIARLANTPLNWNAPHEMGMWILAVIPLAVAGTVGSAPGRNAVLDACLRWRRGRERLDGSHRGRILEPRKEPPR